MKSETLILSSPEIKTTSSDPLGNNCLLTYSIPYLPAYTIINHYLDLTPTTDLDGDLNSRGYELDSDKLMLKYQRILLHGDGPIARLTVQHAGISDHTKLFPYIKNLSRRTRVGQYAFEAEKTFEAGAWASFVIMVGAVVEGVLGTLINKPKLADLLKESQKLGLLSDKEHSTLDGVREARNLIHTNRHESEFIDRVKAMNVYGVYYNFVRRNWTKSIQELQNGHSK